MSSLQVKEEGKVDADDPPFDPDLKPILRNQIATSSQLECLSSSRAGLTRAHPSIQKDVLKEDLSSDTESDGQERWPTGSHTPDSGQDSRGVWK
jgi:hypothetical protein